MQFPAPSETFASNDVLALVKQNINVSIFSLKPKHYNHEKMLDERKLRNIPIYNASLTETFKGILLLIKNPIKAFDIAIWVLLKEHSNFFELLKCFCLLPITFSIFHKIKKTKPDVVHLFWGHYPSLIGYLVTKYIKKKTILTMFLGAYDLNKKLNISKDLASNCQAIFSHSYSNLNTLLNLGIPRNKIKIIYRGIDLNYIDSIKNHAKIHKKSKILTAGRLVKEKKFDLVIKFFDNLIESGGDFILEIVGSGPEFKFLKKLSKKTSIKNKVIFHKHMSQYELFKIMKNSDYFILASQKKSERLPNIVKEAMYCGCICLSSNTQGISELVDDQVNGFIFDKLDSKCNDLFLNISNKKIKDMQKKAKEKIRKDFDISASMHIYKNVWKDLIDCNK